MEQQEITTPGPVLDQKGAIAPGYSRRAVRTYRRAEIRAPFYRIKEWDFYQASDGEKCIQFTYGHASYAGQVGVMLFDFQKGERIADISRLLALPFGRLHLPESAEEDSDVVQLPSGALGALMRENPQVESYVYKAAAERFSDVMSAVERLLFSTLEQRVAAYLLDEAARLGAEEIHVTQEQLARHIGSAREAVTRTLKQMAREGLLEVFRGGIRILDRKALYALC